MTPSTESLALVKWSKPGIIYVARNRVNGKLYVGKTVGRLCNRKAGHKKSVQYGSKLPFHEAIRKYGVDGFDWSIADRCNDSGCLNESEKWWIRNLGSLVHSGYNVARGGDGSSDTRESRALLGKPSKKHPPISDETRIRLSKAQIGRKHSEDTKRKMSAWQLGRKRPEVSGKLHHLYGKHQPDEVRRKLSQAAKERMTPDLKNRLRDANTGRVFSEETKRKISENSKRLNKRGSEHHWYGRQVSEEERMRMSERAKALVRTDEHRAKISAALKGKPKEWLRGIKRSDETRAKMSAAHKNKKSNANVLQKRLDFENGCGL